MAESYRGLTIRIGGDTTKLTQALHTANQAISGTQSSMKKLSDALKMDPTSLKASQLQVGEFASQASNAATRLVTLNNAMRQVGDEIKTFNGSSATVRELADSWGNVNMVASQTRDYYAALTKTIATNYTELSKFHAEAAKVSGVKMAEKLGESFEKMDFNAVISGVAEINTAFGNSKNNLTDLIGRLGEMRQRYTDLTEKAQEYKDAISNFDQNGFEAFTFHGDDGDHTLVRMNAELAEAADEARKNLPVVGAELEKLRAQFRATVSEISSFKGVGTEFKFANDNVDLTSLARGLKEIVAQEKMSVEEADELMMTYIKLKDAFDDAFNNVKTANVVEGFHDLESESAKAEAKVAQLVEQLIKATKADATRGIAGLEEKLKSVASAGDNASARLKQAFEAMQYSVKMGGSPTESQMSDAMRAYADVVSAASEKVRILEAEIAKLGESAISKFAGMSTEGLVGFAQEAEQDYREMAAAVELYEAALNKVNEERLQIKANDEEGYKESERYQELTKQAEAWNEVLRITKGEAKSAQEAFRDMSKAITLRDKEHELEATKATLKELAEINLKPEVDLSAVEGLKKALEAISEGKFNSQGLSSFYDAVKVTNTALDEAKKKYQALSEASKNSPFDKGAYQQKIAAVNEVIDKTVAHIEAMKNALAAIPSDKVNKVAIATNSVAENYALAKKKVDDLNTSMAQTEEKIKQLKEERKNFKIFDDDSQKQADELDQRIKKLQDDLAKLEQEADKALEGLDSAEATRQFEQLSTAINKSTGEVKKYQAEAKGIEPIKVDEAAFMQVVDRVAQAARRMASEVIEASNQIDSAYRDMRKTVNGTEEDFARLRDAAIEYSQHSITSADTMLEMQALGGQLGIAVENLEQFGKITSNLDIATDLDAEEVALKLGQISNVLGLDIEGTQGFADALVRLGNNMPAQESAIMAVAQRFGAVAATASFSGEEVLGWSAAIAATGQRSEAAATAISNTVSGIEQAVANGGSTLKQFAAIASMSSEEFVQSWKDSPTETLRAFIEGLKTLKDSDESAVAALENMGITGVRQQQTLLALTQTIGNLDEALVMSRDAWNGVSDQWGDAGDAAIEAGRKSEGFSGALQILQNNVQNLAATLGDSMVEPMKVLSGAIELVTDALNSMPPFVRDIIVTLGAAGIAFSAVTPMLNVFSKGMLNIVEVAAKSSSIGQFVAMATGLDKVGAAFTAATEGATAFGGILSGPVVLGITAVLGALGLVAAAVSNYNEKQEEFKQATEGLTTATQNAKTSYDNYIAGAKESTRSLAELKTAMEEATEAQANLAGKMKDAWGEIGASEATVDMMVSKIAELTSKQSLTADEQKELNAAVQTFNNLTGNNVQILDGANGELDTTIHSLRQMADGWKDSTESAQHLKDYGETAQLLAEKEKLLAEVQAQLGDSSREQGQWFSDMRENANSTTGSYNDLATQAQQLEQEINSLKDKMKESVSGMGDLGEQVRVVEDAFQATGDSLSNYGDFTDSELRAIVEAFNNAGDGSISALERVKQAIEGLRSGANDASTIAEELEYASKEAAAKRAEAYKSKAADEYAGRKAELDAAYKAAQHGYDAQYKAQQKAFDAQYKSQQKAFDKEYKAQQKALEKQYDALKKKLDAQYNARKKAYDKQLAALKKSQDAEVEAFKKATDAKLKQMEREYKARLKLLEQEYGYKTDDIDERIAALKGETEAEKKAIEERNEADKVAELQKAVTSAKSRRTRAEAEKALNDYLQELDAKRNEDARNAEIERLEDQKDALNNELDERKTILKEQYDDEVAAYKAQREEQLQAIKDANTAEYEAEKERLDGLLEKLKENHTARLEALKESQTAQLEALKESQTEQLEALKESQSSQLEAMKAAQTASLEQLKAAQTEELRQLKKAQDARYKQIKAGNDAEGKAAQKQIADLYKTQETGDQQISDAHARYLSGMERRMQEMGDKNIKASSSANATMNKNTESEMNTLTGTYDKAGTDAPANLASGILKGATNVAGATQGVVTRASAPLSAFGFEGYRWGADFTSNIASGMWSKVYEIQRAALAIASPMYSILHHSVPDKGPLADDDKWGSDFVQNLIDGMHDREHDLARQAEKMARVLEEGFDPTLTVDAAYEALDTIGKNRTKSLGSIVETNSSAPISITLNMNLADVSIRSDADIERLAKVMSQEMATQAARQLAGRLG